MRLLHTSGQHLGQSFYSKSRATERDALFTWLPARAQEHEVNAIVVAGDISDVGLSPSYARELYSRLVIQLQQTSCHLVVLMGSHDSVAVLNESHDILAFLHTTTAANTDYAPIELSLHDGAPGAIFYPVPFLHPHELIASQVGHSGRREQQQPLHTVSNHHREQHQQACALHDDRPLPIIVSSHPATVSASRGGAAHDTYIGALDALPV